MRRTLAALAAALLGCLACAAPASALGRLDGIPTHVRGGERLEIRWSGLDDDVREVELELSLAGGRWVRISPELEALEGRFHWRVPEGLAGPARVRLRAGGGRGEREVAEREFVVTAGTAPGPDVARATPGWWDLGANHGPVRAGLFGPGEPALSPGDNAPVAVPVTAPDAEPAPAAVRERARRAPAAPAPSASPHGFAPPRQLPLRN